MLTNARTNGAWLGDAHLRALAIAGKRYIVVLTTGGSASQADWVKVFSPDEAAVQATYGVFDNRGAAAPDQDPAYARRITSRGLGIPGDLYATFEDLLSFCLDLYIRS